MRFCSLSFFQLLSLSKTWTNFCLSESLTAWKKAERSSSLAVSSVQRVSVSPWYWSPSSPCFLLCVAVPVSLLSSLLLKSPKIAALSSSAVSSRPLFSYMYRYSYIICIPRHGLLIRHRIGFHFAASSVQYGLYEPAQVAIKIHFLHNWKSHNIIKTKLKITIQIYNFNYGVEKSSQRLSITTTSNLLIKKISVF